MAKNTIKKNKIYSSESSQKSILVCNINKLNRF